MSTRHTRTARLFAVVSIAALVLSGVVVQQVVSQALREAGVDADAAASVRRAVLLALSALGVILLGVVMVAGRAYGAALRQLREAVLARARGTATARMPEFTVGELAELASAIERLAAHVNAREARSAREASEVSVLLDTISEGILQLDRAGVIVRANPAAQTLLGLRSATPGQPVTSLIRHAELRRLLERAVAGETIPAAEIALEEQRLIVSARPLDSAGTVIAFMDLTQVRRLESVRRDFVANVSHELKTPLTSIRGYIETLLTDDSLPAEMQHQFLEVVQKNADRLHHIVDDLLDLSRLESGGWRPELHEVNALDVIQDVWSGCSERAERRGIRFVPPQQPLTVIADPGGLRQILTNLLDNAIRYSPDGGRIDVIAHASPRNGNGRSRDHDNDDFVTFEVRDSGAGIPSDALARIFERFYRVDPARSRAEGGTGLGLSIVKHLVESMGGDVRAESELGKGTTIRFRLPAARWQKQHPPELPQSSDS
jgi:two-component system, OmpR family, phosphate regulon sensor histidine kinase PhoR